MAGVHIRWRKRAFRARWDLHGASRFTGRIAAVQSLHDPTLVYTWLVRYVRSGTAGNDPVASGSAVTLSEARLVASRAIFASMWLPRGHRDSEPVWIREAAS